ncbi:MAG: MATE family efflux transporter, partial [Pseudomonadota bacterium]|nr:MATE family efflux transporter [Pseudomonadota bacterium]
LPLSLGMALTVRVGHHLGRGHTDAARRCAWLGVRLNLALALINASVILLGREHIAALYSPDADVVAIGAALLLYAALFQIPDAIQIAAAGALRAYEDTVMVMVITFIAYWIAGLGTGWTLAYLLADPMGAAGFWSGLIAGLTTAAIALLLRLRQQSRKISNLAD